MPARDILLRAAKTPFSTGGVDGDWLFRWQDGGSQYGDHPVRSRWFPSDSHVGCCARYRGALAFHLRNNWRRFADAGGWKHYLVDESMREDAAGGIRSDAAACCGARRK